MTAGGCKLKSRAICEVKPCGLSLRVNPDIEPGRRVIFVSFILLNKLLPEAPELTTLMTFHF